MSKEKLLIVFFYFNRFFICFIIISLFSCSNYQSDIPEDQELSMVNPKKLNNRHVKFKKNIPEDEALSTDNSRNIDVESQGNKKFVLNDKNDVVPDRFSILENVFSVTPWSSSDSKIFYEWGDDKFRKHLDAMEEMRNGSVKATCKNMYDRRELLVPLKFPKDLLGFWGDFRFKVFASGFYASYLNSWPEFYTKYEQKCGKSFKD